MNFLSILSPIFVDLKKKKESAFSTKSLGIIPYIPKVHISFSNPSDSDTPPPHSTKSHSAQL